MSKIDKKIHPILWISVLVFVLGAFVFRLSYLMDLPVTNLMFWLHPFNMFFWLFFALTIFVGFLLTRVYRLQKNGLPISNMLRYSTIVLIVIFLLVIFS